MDRERVLEIYCRQWSVGHCWSFNREGTSACYPCQMAHDYHELYEAALALYEEVELAESVGGMIANRVPSLQLRDFFAAHPPEPSA